MSRTIRPSRSSIVRSAYAAATALCVTRMMVNPRSRWRVLRRSRIVCPLCESRLPVGSSATSRAGSVTRARARATRCCSPPESAGGQRSHRSRARPTRSSCTAARRAAARRPTPRNSSGQATFSSTVKLGKRLKLWNTKPICRSRRSLSASTVSRARSRPATTTRPALGRSSPASKLRSVVLPDPLGPMTERNSPAPTASETSATTAAPLP